MLNIAKLIFVKVMVQQNKNISFSLITNDEQYDEYCELLWDLERQKDESNSDLIDHLDFLITKYESKGQKEEIIFEPVTYLKELMDRHRFSLRKAGEFSGVGYGVINKILNRQINISDKNAVKFGKAFGVDPNVFLKLSSDRIKELENRLIK
ncbi:helix-turn-helix transcriptional regulator [Flammeovirga sp. MY04]|uniref:helix-turn-helix domain-containing protein n=1 Tax=Flammeovirga sp. MY04 TaxID=1191459 RepID=UPI000825AC1C|nr:helix-turn-helix transcriptional regulator [Flammeovirga sp. MY04]ANQ52582.2 helix-turn-helix transcriptional regulator [Flammeovirga sp. MY04]